MTSFFDFVGETEARLVVVEVELENFDCGVGVGLLDGWGLLESRGGCFTLGH